MEAYHSMKDPQMPVSDQAVEELVTKIVYQGKKGYNDGLNKTLAKQVQGSMNYFDIRNQSVFSETNAA